MYTVKGKPTNPQVLTLSPFAKLNLEEEIPVVEQIKITPMERTSLKNHVIFGVVSHSWAVLTKFVLKLVADISPEQLGLPSCVSNMYWTSCCDVKGTYTANRNEACASAQHQQILSCVQEPKPPCMAANWSEPQSLRFNFLENSFTGSWEKSAITWSFHCLWNILIEYYIIVALGSFARAFNAFFMPKEWTNILHVLFPLWF